ncbi:hypothetical protein Clocl_1052 [Acetivibrio clariflavus DSM 19732]|uniref:Uncharacterized protein n=1 Tax=Acetivibrio clariflavus (strain DSM 19732 / NBRC 101661 / EBR45) TaxID=720554 RepID=G8LXL8_ACECE|nr:hypothetical protein Clocl_1052 [Acetivibrio clariflavus DSM 19732]
MVDSQVEAVASQVGDGKILNCTPKVTESIMYRYAKTAPILIGAVFALFFKINLDLRKLRGMNIKSFKTKII